ncbi:unnamed protein product [Phytophthora fragariaefolia]|uniref:Unnamed protein product n=1 Tax=Phytophthora fragariaefolia TaxID=1490495 RepID=A0A9W6TUN2_9STRA|nr:unnamed protein product [Phytophthora fragariaefolia]
MNAAIEQREEEYLHKVAAKNAAHAAALEAEHKAAKDKKKSSMASHVAWVLRRLYAISVVLLLVAMGVLYEWHKHAHGRDHLPPPLVKATMTTVAALLVVNVAGMVATSRSSINGARLLLVIGVVIAICSGLVLDEMKIIRRSQNKLREALSSSKDDLTQDTFALILNGGTMPSLIQRFVFDAPSAFLWWLAAHCTASPAAKLNYESVAIDRLDFFSPLWDDNARSCAAATLGTCTHIDAIVEPVIISELVMGVLQIFFTALFLAISDSFAPGKTSKRRRQLSQLKSSNHSQTSAAALPTALFTRLVIICTAVLGSSNAIASTDMLHFCSITDFHSVFTWMMILCLLSGLSALVAAAFVGCGCKQQLVGVLLVLAVASELYIMAEFIQIAARLIGRGLAAEIDEEQARELHKVYLKASSQTCSSIKRWISHVCVRMSSSESPADFDSSCQHEFVALLVASFNFSNKYMAWSIGVKLVLLMQLILPALRQALVNVLNYVCCVSSREKHIVTMENTLQQALPPVDYEEAVGVYLTSIRIKDPTRVETEREAFENEWSIRSGRKLADVRTRVVIAATDFGAIVRTLMLRRLTAICKLDLSISLSSDGKLALVHISASDNLLLASLCEMATYRLQFADAIDPGRSFWRDKTEVNADQKVLDPNTVKHKLKLLLAEKAMPPKEAVWFSGESLARVSARVHALSRISRASKGIIRCHNLAPAFASYSPSIQRQFIYKKYPNRLEIPDTYRRSVVLRTVDCIRITRHIIDSEFDTSALHSCGLVSSLHCLHSASRFDFNSRGALASTWIAFWRPKHLPGEFWPVDHPILNFIGRFAPFRQPLQDVRDYCGEKIAFYFAWIAFYAKMLALPAFTAAVVIVCSGQHSVVAGLWIFFSSPHSSHTGDGDISEGFDKIGATLSSTELVLGLVAIVWGFVLAKTWERRSVWYQLQWGVATSVSVCDFDSFRFTSNHIVVQKPSICSELTFLQHQLGSWFCVLILGSANLMVVLLLLLSQGLFVDIWGEKFAVLGSCLCQAFLIQWNSACIPRVANILTTWERRQNTSEDSVHHSSVVAKLFTLQFFNTFTGLMLLMLSSVGGLALLARFVVPLQPLYLSYNARIEGHVGIFIQIETLVLAVFAVQLCMRVILILSGVKKFCMIQRGEQDYSSNEHEEETMLSTYPGPDKDYVQLVMQIGLMVMFSGACPLLPLLVLADCAVKLRQNALELCCIRQRPEPEGAENTGDDIGVGLWAPWLRFMLQISVPVALAVPAFTAGNYDDISIERRVGWWLIGVLGIWLGSQLLWVLVPRESCHAEEARARNTFLVERYFGHAEANDPKVPSHETEIKHIARELFSLQESLPSAEQSLHHYEERAELLQRLNVALRKREEIRVPLSTTNEVVLDAATKEKFAQAAQKEITDEMYPTSTQDAETSGGASTGDDVMQRLSESSEEMIVGYFRPVRGLSPLPLEQPTNDAEEVKEDVKINVAESVDTPTLMLPRRGSILPGYLPQSEMKISDGGEEVIASSGVEGESVASGRPAPMRLSKLFKRIPVPPSRISSSLESDDVEKPSEPATSSIASLESPFLQPGVDSTMFAPMRFSVEDVADNDSSSDDEVLEEKAVVPAATSEDSRVSIAPPVLEVESPLRRFSPGLSFLSRKPKPPASVHSDNSNRGSEVGTNDQTEQHQFSPRLSFLTRKSKRSSSKGSDIELGKSSVGSDSSVVPEQPASRKLSKLFKRVQPPSSAAPPPQVDATAPFPSPQVDAAASPLPPQVDPAASPQVNPSAFPQVGDAAPPPPSQVDAVASTLQREDSEGAATDPKFSFREELDFLSDARACLPIYLLCVMAHFY